MHEPGHIEPYTGWQSLGWSGEAAGTTDEPITGIEGLLGQFFTTPGEYTQYFEDYDPLGEQMATKQMQLGQQQAQHQAQGSMWKQFEAGRQGKGGFGGAGRARQAAMGGIHKGLAQGREQAQLGLQEDIRGMHEQYRGDVMGQIGQLFAGGAQAGEAGSCREQALQVCKNQNPQWLNSVGDWDTTQLNQCVQEGSASCGS